VLEDFITFYSPSSKLKWEDVSEDFKNQYEKWLKGNFKEG